MVYLEKIEVTEETVKYYYYQREGDEKGILIYLPKTGACKVEKFCEDDDEYYEGTRHHAFVRMIKYYREKKYPEKEMVAWG